MRARVRQPSVTEVVRLRGRSLRGRTLTSSATGKVIRAARLTGRRGAAATELAILLPFLALAFAVALDFCRVYHTTQTIQSSAHAGALYASGTAYAAAGTTAEDAAKQAAVTEAASLQPPLDAGKVAVTFTKTAVSVTVTYDFPMLTSLVGGSRSVTVTRSVTMNLAP